jgi:lipid-binding SYLF domain-containing protein
MVKASCVVERKLLMTMAAVFAAAAMVFAGSPAAASSKDAAKAQEVVDSAIATVGNFKADPDMSWFRDNVKNARGILVVPSLVKAGFVLGGSGGTGVLMGRDETSGRWSYPAFFTMGSATFGFAAGVEKSEVILMIMTNKGMDSMLSTSFKLGGDVSVAVGPVGAGAKAQTADVIAFSRAKGVYGGVNLEGAVISTRDSLNSAYYGKPVRTVDIVVKRSVHNKNAEPLLAEVRKVAGQ